LSIRPVGKNEVRPRRVNILKQMRVQMPRRVLEMIQNRLEAPFELGFLARKNVVMHPDRGHGVVNQRFREACERHASPSELVQGLRTRRPENTRCMIQWATF